MKHELKEQESEKNRDEYGLTDNVQGHSRERPEQTVVWLSNCGTGHAMKYVISQRLTDPCARVQMDAHALTFGYDCNKNQDRKLDDEIKSAVGAPSFTISCSTQPKLNLMSLHTASRIEMKDRLTSIEKVERVLIPGKHPLILVLKLGSSTLPSELGVRVQKRKILSNRKPEFDGKPDSNLLKKEGGNLEEMTETSVT